ncbi:MAG TPA: DUF3568 family protein [Sedimentisphaerales bacterium]|nr:DUF3568 family protein [Sedimentisphaerales bacterium]
MDVRVGILGSLLVGLLISCGGCGAGGAVSRMRGEAATEEAYGIEPTYEAARQALESLKLKIIEDETGADALSAHVTARDSGGTKVYVRLRAITANTTRVLVQVGAFGDEGKTRRIQETIRERLQAGSKAPEAQKPAPAMGYVFPLAIPIPVQPTQPSGTTESQQPASPPADSSDSGTDPSAAPTP